MFSVLADTSAVVVGSLFQDEEDDGLYHWLLNFIFFIRDPFRGSLSLSLVLPLTSPFLFNMMIAAPTMSRLTGLPGNLEAGAAAVVARSRRGRDEGGQSGGTCDWSSSDELTIRRTGISCFCLPRSAPSLHLRAQT